MKSISQELNWATWNLWCKAHNKGSVTIVMWQRHRSPQRMLRRVFCNTTQWTPLRSGRVVWQQLKFYEGLLPKKHCWGNKNLTFNQFHLHNEMCCHHKPTSSFMCSWDYSISKLLSHHIHSSLPILTQRVFTLAVWEFGREVCQQTP